MTSLKDNLTVLVSRELYKYIKCLSGCARYLVYHIDHTYSNQRATKSEVAVLNVLHLNEAKNRDILEIMKNIASYLGPDFTEIVLSSGDQMTTERMTCCKRYNIMMDADTPHERQEQLEPSTEDWHCLMCLLEVCIQLMHSIGTTQTKMLFHIQVIWRLFFSTSSRDHGTLGQLLCQIGRLPKAKKPKKDLHACLDALMTVFKGHTIAVACSILELESPDADAEHLAIPTTAREKKAYMNDLTKKVVEQITIVPETFLGLQLPSSRDQVFNYAHQLCHYSSLVVEFIDAWAEEDDER